MSGNLITGGLGFLGSHLARQLLNQGEEVIIFDILSGSKLVENIKEAVKIVRGDLANWPQVLDAVKSNDIDCIYHCGAILPPLSEENPAAAVSVNINGMLNVLEVARLFNVANVIFASSLSAFGLGVSSVVGDDATQKPVTVYGMTKVFSENLGDYYHRKFRVNFRGVRFPSILGPGRRGGFASYTSLMIEKPALGQPFTAPVGETAKISLLYIKDAVLSLLRLKQADDASLTRRVYNLEGFSPTAKEIAEAVKKHLSEAQIEFQPSESIVRLVNASPKQVDDTNARRDWGWKPQYDLDEAVRDFLAEIQANRTIYE